MIDTEADPEVAFASEPEGDPGAEANFGLAQHFDDERLAVVGCALRLTNCGVVPTIDSTFPCFGNIPIRAQ